MYRKCTKEYIRVAQRKLAPMAATTAKTPMVSASMNEDAEMLFWPADVPLLPVGLAPLPDVAEAPAPPEGKAEEGATGAVVAGIKVGVVPLQLRPISVNEDA